MKTKIHFNRVNMQRKDPRVWSAHTYKACNMAKKVVVRYKGRTILETVYNENGTQPRACLVADGDVVFEDGVAILEVE